MPFNKRKTKSALRQNIATEINAGKPLKQAEAIAYSVQGENKITAGLKRGKRGPAY